MQSSGQIKFDLPSSLLVEKPGVCDSETLVRDSVTSLLTVLNFLVFISHTADGATERQS